MRTLTLLCVLCVAAHLVASLPVEPLESAVQEQQPQEQQETLITLDLGDPKHELSARDKRTIGFLRQLFPGLSQIIDNVIQSITRYLFRVIGRLVLRGGLLGGGGGGGGGDTSSSSNSDGNGGRRISITLPTYPPSADDDEDEEDNTEAAQSDLNPEGENQLAGAESQQNEVRVQFTEPEQSYDQESAASGGNDAVDGETEEDQRNKRFLNFGASADASGGSSSSSGSGSGGGSGNFLFDIIRQTANRVARAAGTVYRVVAGTESLDLGLGLGVSARKSTTRTSTNLTTTMTTNKGNGTVRALIAGSGNTESSDEGKSAEISAGGDAHAVKDDGYQAGVPGPITRLLVIANRGLANLMQDLILRLAQTSERIVNFKARLITSII